MSHAGSFILIAVVFPKDFNLSISQQEVKFTRYQRAGRVLRE